MLDLVYAADGLLLACPVYYENVTAQMKAFMDRNVFRYAHDEWLPARAVGLLAVTAETGLDDALDAMRRYVALSTVSEVPTVRAACSRTGCGGGVARWRSSPTRWRLRAAWRPTWPPRSTCAERCSAAPTRAG